MKKKRAHFRKMCPIRKMFVLRSDLHGLDPIPRGADESAPTNNLELTHTGSRTFQVVRLLCSLLDDTDLDKALSIVENLPKTLLIDVEKEVVDVLYQPLTEAGASVTMTESAMSKTIHPTAAKSQLDGAASNI